MAMIRFCDWLKKPLDKNDPVFEVIIQGGDGETLQYEVSDEGRAVILSQLDGDVTPNNAKPRVIEKIVPRDPPPQGLIGDAPGLDVQATDDPFDSEGGGDDLGMPNIDDGVPPLEIPTDVKQRLKAPSREQADKVVAESTKFKQGSLPTLTQGGSEQLAAAKKLREFEAEKNRELQRNAPDGVEVNVGPKPNRHM